MTEILNRKSIRKEIYTVIIPVILENILQLSAGLVTMAMIGRLSPIDVSAQGLCVRLTDMVWCLFKGISIGTMLYVTREYGCGNRENIKKIVLQVSSTVLLLSIIFQQLFFWKPDWILSFYNPPTNILLNGIDYLQIIVWGLPFVAIMSMVTGTLQGVGDTKTPMWIAVGMNTVNIIMGYTLIFGKMGFQALGLKGAAIALVCAQGIGALAGIIILFRKKGVLGPIRIEELSGWNLKWIKKVYGAGIPASFESMFWQMAAILISKVILSYGEIAFSAHQMGIQAESIAEMPAIGFGVASTIFVGRAVGKKDKYLEQQYMRELVKGSAIISICGSIIMIFFPKLLMRALTTDAQVIELGMYYIFLMGLIQLPQNLSRIFNGALRALGYTKLPMIIAGIGLWGIRVPLSYLLAYVFHVNIIAIWVIICLDQAIRFIISVIFYKKEDSLLKRWRKEVISE